MGRSAIAVGLGCGLLGFVAGWLAAGSLAASGSAPAAPVVAERPASVGDPERAAGAAMPERAERVPSTAPGAAVLANRPAEDVAAENRALRAELESLRRERADASARIAESEGHAVAAPPDLPARFGQDALVTHFQEALRGTRSRGQVESVDCTEFPCILHGRLELDGPDDHRLEPLIEKLRASYAGDEFYVSQSTYVGDDGKAYQRVSATFYTRSVPEAERAALNLRLRWRKNAYMDAPAE